MDRRGSRSERAIRPHGRGAGPATFTAGLAALALVLVLSACYPGTYTVDVFPEMHYQPSLRPYEPPRASAPASAVPVDGRGVPPPADFGAVTDLRNPVPTSPETIQRANQLYRVNCLPCHGADGKGGGIVAQYFTNAQLPPPVDFASARARSRTDGQLYFLISNGIGNMPPFRNLLSDEERWLLVHFVRGVQAQNPQS